MIIFDGNASPVLLHNICGPNPSEHFWVLDLIQKDFMLAPFMMLEEVTCPSITISAQGFEFTLPADWYVLVYDRETAQLDVIQLSDCAGREFTALVYGPTNSTPTPGTITAVDYHIEYKNVSPSLSKHQMLCHPISPTDWVCVGPSDCFNKYLKDIIVGDLL